jgi:hypothetical protein
MGKNISCLILVASCCCWSRVCGWRQALENPISVGLGGQRRARTCSRQIWQKMFACRSLYKKEAGVDSLRSFSIFILIIWIKFQKWLNYCAYNSAVQHESHQNIQQLILLLNFFMLCWSEICRQFWRLGIFLFGAVKRNVVLEGGKGMIYATLSSLVSWLHSALSGLN